MTAPTASDFDEWYANMALSPVFDGIVQRELDLPPGVQSSSLLPGDGITEVAAALRLGGGSLLLDLACGRGGYGMEIARRTGTRVLGVDHSPVAIEQARQRAASSDLADQAEFRVGALTGTGLAAQSIDAVLCVDAIQFAEPTDAALRECRRVLVPGGRIAITCWEAVDAGNERVPQRLRRMDLAPALARAGFDDVRVVDRPDWRAAERRLWEAATALDPGDDLALQALQEEGREILAIFDAVRRVFATAAAPR
jgi:SAM-dependent methyltransferase